MYKTIGIVTGGGDAPGLNAVIRSVVKSASGNYSMRVVGVENSFEGLLEPTRTRELSPGDVRGILPRGGTILGTRNRGRFVEQTPQGDVIKRGPVFKEALANLERLGIEALVAVGGEGTLGIAAEFNALGFPVVCVPKTIDNDLAATELTFGFATALDIATEALDRLHTTAASHDRVMVLEVMGRNAGWIALHSGIAGGADVILVPEIPFWMQVVADKVMERDKTDRPFSIIVVAEGAREADHSQMYLTEGDSRHNPRLGGIGNYCASALERLTGKESRCVVLGHLQRGGRPNAFDRMLATSFGASAVRALADGARGMMVALQSSSVIRVPITQAVGQIKTVPPNGQLVQTGRDVGISFGTPNDTAHSL